MTQASQRPTRQLANAGVSIWLDDLSRSKLRTGELEQLIRDLDVVGVTTNPTIFAQSISSDSAYREQLEKLGNQNLTAEQKAFALMQEDVAAACDAMHDVFVASEGIDGWVSIEVSPELANDAEATIDQALLLNRAIAKPNLMIKVPATQAGLEAVARLTAQGICVNVTLIFSIMRYRQVVNAYLTGIECARQSGHDIRTIHSVASVFISRFDTLVDSQTTRSSVELAGNSFGQFGISNAQAIYQAFEEIFSSSRALYWRDQGMNVQRPLWASTGVKDDRLAPAHYVEQLVTPGAINTMPEKTLSALSELDDPAFTMAQNQAETETVLNAFANAGLNYTEVVDQLEAEGIAKFVSSWSELLATIEETGS